MNLTNNQLLAVAATTVLAVTYVVAACLEYFTSRTVTKTVYQDGQPTTVTEQSKEGIDLEIFRLVTGLGAILSGLWAFQTFSV